MTPLRQCFIDDLRLKNFSDGTIKVYVHAVEKFARFLGRSPDESTAQDVRAFLIHELDRGLSRSYCVIQRNALRHLYLDTLGRPDELKAVIGKRVLPPIPFTETFFDLTVSDLRTLMLPSCQSAKQ